MQIEALKVTDYIKTEGTDSQGYGVGTSGIKDDKKANFTTELRTLSVDNAFYDNKGKRTDEDFMDDVKEASALGMSTTEKVKNIERAWDDEATAKVRADGHDPMNMEPETLITVVDEIKMNLAKGGADISKMGGLSSAEIEAMSGSIAQAVEMSKGLSENLPVQTQAYLVKNELEPTIENIYNASYSAPEIEKNAMAEEDVIRLLEDLGSKLDSLIEQVEGEQSAQGPMSPAELKDTVATMMMQDVPVTKEHLEYMVQLQNYEKPSEENIVNAIGDIVAEGKEPKEAYLIEGYSLMDQAKQTYEEVMAMDPYALETVTAQRQLTEIQLTMTVEATFTMMKNGIEVNTNDLTDLLDKLKLQETNLLQILMRAENNEATTANVNLYKQVMDEMADIQAAPVAMFGKFNNIGMETFSYVHEVSVSMTAEYSRMEMTYEAVGTEVRKDLGDSISKAFRNVDEILDDLGIETTSASQKAVRVLAYNQMEITADSVNSMKASTETVARTFKSMTPAVVAEMIKRGDNPLDMTMDELKSKAEEIKAELGSDSDSESFSKFLWKAQHASEITESEREAYIGVYRLLHQVEKSDGAAIGALISQGTEVTLRNLMTAVRSGKHTGREYEVSDKFGQLDEMVVEDLSITEQIEKVFLTNRCRDAKEAMSPAKMGAFGEDAILNMNPDEFATAMETELDVQSEEAYNSYVSEQVKAALSKDANVAEILDEFNIPHSANMINAVEAMVENNGKAIKDLFGRAAKQNRIDSAEKIFKAESLDEADTVASRVAERRYTNSVNARAESLEISDLSIDDLINIAYARFEEACNGPDEMREAEELLGDLAEQVMKNMMVSEEVRTIDMDGMKLVMEQVKAMEEMAATGETYHIPMMMNNEVSTMALRVVRGVSETGMIRMAMNTQMSGSVQTTFHYEAGEVNAQVECENSQTRNLFANQAEEIADIMQQRTGFKFNFSFERTKGLSASDIYDWQTGSINVAAGNGKQAGSRNVATENGKQAGEDNEIQTTALYGIARSYLTIINQMF